MFQINLLSRTYKFVSVGEYELVEERLSSLTHPADGRRFSLRVALPSSSRPVELAHVAVHGDYFSNRLMIKQLTGPNTYASLYAVSGSVVNVTRLCAVLLEQYQLDNGKIDFDAINCLLTYVIVLFTEVSCSSMYKNVESCHMVFFLLPRCIYSVIPPELAIVIFFFASAFLFLHFHLPGLRYSDLKYNIINIGT
jgi:hypothetical protein